MSKDIYPNAFAPLVWKKYSNFDLYKKYTEVKSGTSWKQKLKQTILIHQMPGVVSEYDFTGNLIGIYE